MSTNLLRAQVSCWPLPYWRKACALVFPFIPNQVSMFLIGSITSATFVLATWRYGWKNGLVIAWIAPVVAHLQGMLPLPPFILITGPRNDSVCIRSPLVTT